MKNPLLSLSRVFTQPEESYPDEWAEFVARFNSVRETPKWHDRANMKKDRQNMAQDFRKAFERIKKNFTKDGETKS